RRSLVKVHVGLFQIVQFFGFAEGFEAQRRAPFVLPGKPPRKLVFTLLFPRVHMQRNAGAGTHFRHVLDAVQQVTVVRIVLAARKMIGGQRDYGGIEGLARTETSGGNGVPWQGAGTNTFANELGIDSRGQGNVRIDAAMLGTFSGYTIVLADRQRELSKTFLVFGLAHVLIERVKILHRALAKGLLPDDDAARIVLYCSGENLRRRSAVAVYQHCKGTVVGDACHGIGIVQPANSTIRTAELHYRPVVDEEPGERSSFSEVPTAVIAQIDDQAVYALFFQLLDQLFHVLGRACVVLVAVTQSAKVAVKARRGYDADRPVTPVAGNGNDIALGCLLFQLYLVPDQADGVLWSSRQRVSGKNLQL